MQTCHLFFQHAKKLTLAHIHMIRESSTLLALREDCATGRACIRPEEMKPFSPKRLLPRMRLWPAALEK